MTHQVGGFDEEHVGKRRVVLAAWLVLQPNKNTKISHVYLGLTLESQDFKNILFLLLSKDTNMASLRIGLHISD